MALAAIASGTPAGTVRAEGSADFSGPASRGSVQIGQVSLPWLAHRFQVDRTWTVERGGLDGSFGYAWSGRNGARALSLQEIVLDIRDVALSLAGALRVSWRHLHGEAHSADPAARSASGIAVSVDAPAFASTGKGGAALHIAGRRMAVQGGSVDLSSGRITVDRFGASGFSWRAGRQRGEMPAGSLQGLQVDLRAHRVDTTALAIQAAQWGRWTWKGSLRYEPWAADGAIAVRQLDLRLLQPLLAERFAVRIERGPVSAAGALRVRTTRQAAMRVHFAGRVDAGEMRIVDPHGGRPLLSWTVVRVPRIALDWPGRLRVQDIEADGLAARIAIGRDHRLNWDALRTPPKARPEPPAAAMRTASSPGLAIDVNRVVLVRGAADFTDASLRTPFHAHLRALEGEVGPFASDAPQEWSAIRLRGSVNREGRVDVTGRAAPMADPLRADVTVHFHDIEMPTLNPYAAEIAGYRVEQGMLELQLHYTIANGRIDGTNRMRIDQLVLGPQVHSADAPSLPMRLIVDMLKNDRGEIDLDVPVEGNLNDPNFTIRNVVFAAIRGALRMVVEAPFQWIAHLLGGAPEKTLREVGFAPGSAVVPDADRQNLQEIGNVLRQHPNLLVFIHPAYDAAADMPKPEPAAEKGPGAASTTVARAHAPERRLRRLAIQRAEAVKKVLTQAGVADRRVFIDEPVVAGAGKATGKNPLVGTSLEVKAR